MASRQQPKPQRFKGYFQRFFAKKNPNKPSSTEDAPSSTGIGAGFTN
jgi:hypothetical protein